jgi:hypothetical protein
MIIRNILYLWLLALPFSHTPSFKHPLISFPGVAGTLIIGYTIINIKGFREFTKNDRYTLGFLLGYFLFIGFSDIFRFESLHSKYINHFLGLLWFFLLMFSVTFQFRVVALSKKIAYRLLFIGFIISVFYSFLETASSIFFIDIGSYLPRYDRNLYRFKFGFFYRTRAFNYESANFAMYLNVVALLMLFYYKRLKERFIIILLWVPALFLTYSAFQIAILCAVTPMIFGRALINLTNMKKNIFKWFGITLLLSILLGAIIHEYSFFEKTYKHIKMKATSSISSNTRDHLRSQGIKLVSQKPVMGHGFGGYYFYLQSGLNNFYLTLFADKGVMSLGFFILLFSFCIRTISNYRKSFILIIITWTHMYYIGDYWIPQLILPFALSSLNVNSKLLESE